MKEKSTRASFTQKFSSIDDTKNSHVGKKKMLRKQTLRQQNELDSQHKIFSQTKETTYRNMRGTI